MLDPLKFKTQLQAYVNDVEAYLAKLPWLAEEDMCTCMRYSLMGGGKRIRPVLALAAAETLGAQPLAILPAAAALELIHTYSLIHDDLPAMDDDDYRRGRLANHKMFGEGKAILAGAGLLTYAFELLSEPLPVSADQQLRVIREVAAAAGYVGMIGGQADDLTAEIKLNEGRDLSLAELEQIHRRKTGALLLASVRLGAMLGGGTDEQISALSAYARHLGLAFQIKDDILDLEEDSETLGKPAGSDLRRGKATYPALLGLPEAKMYLREQIRQAQAALSGLQGPVAFLADLADYIEQRHY
ncbi:MAG: polyprenyl synthetase family protein [Peptococcaceae bacterium]|nr:polyprenyl synthetase family protein [Peptococcaceae bacterium]